MCQLDNTTTYIISSNPCDKQVHQCTIGKLRQEIVIPKKKGTYCFIVQPRGLIGEIVTARILDELYTADVTGSVIEIDGINLIGRAKTAVNLLCERGNTIIQRRGSKLLSSFSLSAKQAFF